MLNLKASFKKYVDRLWKFSDEFAYEIIAEDKDVPFGNEKPAFADEAVNAEFRDANRYPHVETVRRLKKRIIIEPDYSYCIVNFNTLITSSVFYPDLKPSFPRYVKAVLQGRLTRLPAAVMFDGNSGGNYFHFFSDVLGKIWVMQRLQLGADMPWIISRKIYNMKYFQYLLLNTEVGKINWKVQEPGEYIQVEEIYLVRPKPYRQQYFEQAKRLMNLNEETPAGRRVFLSRNKASGRCISNMPEIEDVLKKYGFETVETEGKNLKEQAQLFNSVKYLIGIHGAGLTNIIFSQPGLCLLEINPENRIASHYYWLAKTVQAKYYDVVLGGKLPSTRTYPEKDFHLSADKLEAAIQKMLAH